MKVKSTKFLILGAVLAASVSLAGVAYADSVSGVAWDGVVNSSTQQSIPSTLPVTTPNATFTLSSPTGVFNLNSNNTSNGYTLGGFLASGGDTVAATYSGGAAATDNVDNTLFNFTGTIPHQEDEHQGCVPALAH